MTKITDIPAIRFKGFSDTWEQRKFDDITYPAGEKNRDNLPYESYSVTNENGFIPQNEQFENGGTMATADKSMYYIVSKNSFAYNPARINVGSIGYYDKPENVIVSSLYEVFKTSEDIDDRFLWHWFKSDAFQRMIEQYQEGGVRLYFYYDKLCMCSLPVPDIQEQRKIGKQLDILDNLITLHQRKYDKLTNVKKSMLGKMFPQNGSNVPEIRFKGFTEAWEQRKFSDLVQIERGGSPRPIDDFITDSPDGLNWVKIGDAPAQGNYITKTAEKIKPEGLSKTREVHPGDLILSNSMSFGKPYIMGIDGCIHDGWLLIRNTYKVFDLTFLCHLLGTPQMIIQYKSLAAGSTVNNLNKELVGNTVVTIPTIKEQRVLGQYLETLDNLITLHQRKCQIDGCRFQSPLAITWEQRKLGEIGSVSMCRRIFKEQTSENGEIPFYKIGTFGGEADAFISRELFEEYKAKYQYPKKGDILISASGSIGRTVVFTGKNEYFQDSNIVWLNHDKHLDNSFLKCFYSIVKWAGIEGSTIKRLYNDNILNTAITLPSVEEQQKIGAYFENLDNLITLHQCE